MTTPKQPYDTVGGIGVEALKVRAVEVAVVTSVVPPAAFVHRCTVNAFLVIVMVCVESRELHVVMISQRIAYKIGKTQTHSDAKEVYGSDQLR